MERKTLEKKENKEKTYIKKLKNKRPDL